MNPDDQESDRDATGDLAEVLGLAPEDFADLFGAEWRENHGPVAHDYDADPSGGEGAEVTPWFIAGEPPQLMIRVFYHGVFLARPEGRWVQGTHDLQ